MKKMFVILFLISTLIANAQTDIKSVKEVTCFGVDFSKVKVFDAKETPEKFKVAFQGINGLLETEAKKYNFAKAFEMTITSLSPELANERNEAIVDGELKVKKGKSKAYRLTPEVIQEVVGNYKEGEGVGFLLLAESLDKGKGVGVYHGVFFDINSGEVIFSKRVEGEVGGAGLRNFWARTVYEVIKKWNFKPNKK